MQLNKRLRHVFIVVAAGVAIHALYLLSHANYLLFHSSVEVFSIVITFTIFAIAWNSRRMMDSSYLLFIGIACLFVGGLDLVHTLAYKGMGVFPEYGSNLATQLWLATRYLLSISFLAALFFVNRRFRPSTVFAGYSVVTALVLGSIFYWENFPVAFIEGVGLTPFKVISEYVISLILLSAIILLIIKRREFSGSIVKLMVAAMAVAIAADMAFTLYTDVFGIANLIGHLLIVVSFFLIYKALIETGLTKPYELLFRNLKQNEVVLTEYANDLTEVNDRLVQEVAERKKVEEALRESKEQLRLKLDSVLSPNADIGEQELSNIIDVHALQSMMQDLCAVTKVGFSVIDLKGNVLVDTGWQDICAKFHRANPQTLKNCVESDLTLTQGVKQGEFRIFKCKNNMWDIVTPIIIGGKHMANIHSGQFFFEDEKVNREMFAAQAEKYGFDKEAYMSAFDRIPRWSREKVKNMMMFYTKLADLISKLSYSNFKLAKLLIEQKTLRDQLEHYSKHLEALVEEKTRQLKDSERLAAIGQTAGMVGHDIRNPLQAIIGEVYLANTELSSLPNSEEKTNLLESLKMIKQNIEYINKIVLDLQDFAKPLNPFAEETNIEQMIQELLMKNGVSPKIHTETKIEADARIVWADSAYIRRIFGNLVSNAVQAMPDGGKLTIQAHREKDTVVITVQDTGVGIPENAKDKLFTPLFTTKAKGQGFGLAVVKRLTEALGGIVTFESQEGKGTTFTIRLPAPNKN
ncbi:GHKL domain-containing protein [Candidatus Bathyarchaeota archaeon A05DMB-2]|jgi:signal transduction histidine kinase/PAS domain-containing protein|nr:GHKL domain-containing protein [Candidatus Bathyarchaeota archaeon A05DMB-2]